MLNTFSKNTYNKIKILEGTNNKVNPNHPIVPMKGGAREKMTHIQAGNNILSSGGYSLHQFQKAIGKAEKTVVKVAKDTGNSVIKSIPSVVTKSFEGAVVPALTKLGTNYLLPAAEVAEEVAPLALMAAGRGIKGVQPVALKRWVQHVKDYQKKHGGTYKECMSKAKASYKK